ncbi:hypothetical protein HDU76_004246 [Blyttiomyces sp. JEL0837]|nr:hypothetical protein HDU76_004246 [Blyttiomyces sp. JEL0837]
MGMPGAFQAVGFNFSPIERDLKPGVVVKIGRKVDRHKDKSGNANANAAAAAGAAPASAAPLASPSSAGPIGNVSGGADVSQLSSSAPTTSNSSFPAQHMSRSLTNSGAGPLAAIVAATTGLTNRSRATDTATVLADDDHIGDASLDDISPYAASHNHQQNANANNNATTTTTTSTSTTTPSTTQLPPMPGMAHSTSGQSSVNNNTSGASNAGTSSSTAAPGGTGTSGAAGDGDNKGMDFVAFRSKVVSRTHAEMWVTPDGQLMFRDVGSSSGTFLNRLRMSPSGKESRPYHVKSGDIVQLGVDYQGRQEEIYNLRTALRALLAATNPTAKDPTDASCTDCCICLSQISPQQSLFLAPCSHCFHYRCVMPLLSSNVMFQCPLCRQVANLDAPVFDESEEDAQLAGYGNGGDETAGDDDEWMRLVRDKDEQTQAQQPARELRTQPSSDLIRTPSVGSSQPGESSADAAARRRMTLLVEGDDAFALPIDAPPLPQQGSSDTVRMAPPDLYNNFCQSLLDSLFEELPESLMSTVAGEDLRERLKRRAQQNVDQWCGEGEGGDGVGLRRDGNRALSMSSPQTTWEGSSTDGTSRELNLIPNPQPVSSTTLGGPSSSLPSTSSSSSSSSSSAANKSPHISSLSLARSEKSLPPEPPLESNLPVIGLAIDTTAAIQELINGESTASVAPSAENININMMVPGKSASFGSSSSSGGGNGILSTSPTNAGGMNSQRDRKGKGRSTGSALASSFAAFASATGLLKEKGAGDRT